MDTLPVCDTEDHVSQPNTEHVCKPSNDTILRGLALVPSIRGGSDAKRPNTDGLLAFYPARSVAGLGYYLHLWESPSPNRYSDDMPDSNGMKEVTVDDEQRQMVMSDDKPSDLKTFDTVDIVWQETKLSCCASL